MNKKNKPRSYQDFIEDEDFIIWILTEDSTKNNFWNEYIVQNPNLKNDFQKAILTCKTIRPSGDKLDAIQRRNLLYSIKQSSTHAVKRKRTRRFSIYAAAACTLLIISMSVLFFNRQEKLNDHDLLFTLLDSTNDNVEDVHIISGSNLKVVNNEETLVQTQKGDILIGENGKI